MLIECKTRTGTDFVPVYTLETFPFDKLKISVLYAKNTKRRKHKYCKIFATFDIETTTYTNGETYKGFMYLWSFTIDGIVCIGRTWEEFRTLLEKIHDRLSLSYKGKRLVIYVFNLPFEYQFMFRFFDTDSLFCVEKRKVVTWCCCNGFEFRCAYKLTNKSLYRFTNDIPQCVHVKAKDDLDFKVFRTPFTHLTDKEIAYSVNDTLGLWEAIMYMLIGDGDNLYTVPLTSTGYPRRDVLNNIKSSENYTSYRKKLEKMALDEYLYTIMLEASRGGDTHANRFKAGYIWHDVDSFDAVSEYPYIMLTKKYPSTPFTPYGEIESIKELYNLHDKKYAFICRVYIRKCEAKDSALIPCIPLSKCLKSPVNYRCDNGRILEGEDIYITLTDIDFFRLIDEYNIDGLRVGDLYISKYDFLPREIREVIFEYFKIKTDIKNERKKNKSEELEYNYMKSKNKLNGIFGMMYSKPIHDEIEHINGEWTKKPTEKDIEKAQVKTLLWYPWGVWTTAHGRAHLQRLITSAKGELIYCDTDSAKGQYFDLESIEKENEKIRLECENMGIVYKGEYLGVYERESEHDSLPCYKRFKTLGAKKYAYDLQLKGGVKFGCTISGVGKKEGAESIGCLENFHEKFIVNPSGGSTLYYHDDHIHNLNFGDGTFTCGASIGMVDRHYEIGITEEQYFLYYLRGFAEEFGSE